MISEELRQAKENIRFAISKAKTDNQRLNCPQAKKFNEEFLKGARESFAIAEMKAGVKK